MSRNTLSKRILNKIQSLIWDIMKVDFLRYYVCFLRWILLRKKLKIHEGHGKEVASSAISYNLTAFANPKAAFGMARRMSLAIFPIASFLRNQPDAKILIIGPRTEDDIFWARSLGLRQTIGLDLFSYSPYIEVGDMHQIHHKSKTFDAVILGWVLAYSTKPEVAVLESIRLLKPGGFLAVGMESINPKEFNPSLRNNALNTLDHLNQIVKIPPIVSFDPDQNSTREVVGIYRLPLVSP